MVWLVLLLVACASAVKCKHEEKVFRVIHEAKKNGESVAKVPFVPGLARCWRHHHPLIPVVRKGSALAFCWDTTPDCQMFFSNPRLNLKPSKNNLILTK